MSAMTATASSPALEIARLAPDGFSGVGMAWLDLDRHLGADPGMAASPSPPLEFGDGEFDLIWSLSAFSRLSGEWGEWLRELHRLLGEEGLLIAAVPGVSGAVDRAPQGVDRSWVALRKRPAGEEVPAPAEASELTGGLAALFADLDAGGRRSEDAVRESFNRELMRKAFRIAELELGPAATPALWAISERVAARYEATLSWRVTRPVRAAKRLLRRR